MIKIIKADLRRILRKPLLWVFIAFSLVSLASSVISLYVQKDFSSFNLMSAIIPVSNLRLFTGSVVFLSVYGDEFKSMAMTTLIGRGYSRSKIIFEKFLVSILITLIIHLIFGLGIAAAILITGADLSAIECRALILQQILNIYSMTGHFVIASIFMYLTGNSTLSLFIYLAQVILIPIIEVFTKDMLIVRKFNLNRYYYDGIGQMAYADIQLGMIGSGIFTLLAGLVLFAGVSLLISVLVFRKKELDF